MLSIGVWTFLRVYKQVEMNMSMARDPRGVKVKTTFFSTPSHFVAFGAVNWPRTSQHKQLPRQAKSPIGPGQNQGNIDNMIFFFMFGDI